MNNLEIIFRKKGSWVRTCYVFKIRLEKIPLFIIIFFLCVLNFTGLLTNIVAKWPGSTHDRHIFRRSALGRQLEEGGGGHGLAEGVLLGDSGHACSPFLLTPYS